MAQRSTIKTLHVYKVYTPFGGISRVMESIIGGLRDRVDARVLTSKECGRGSLSYMNGVPVRRVYSLGQILSLPIAPTLPMWLWWYAKKVDIVHTHSPFPLVDLAVSIWFPQKTALVVHWHSRIVTQKRTGHLIAPLTRRCLERADCIIVATPVSIETSSYLQQFRHKCVVIPNGTDIRLWTLQNAEQEAQVAALKVRYPKIILAVGRLVSYKGFEVLLRAMVTVPGDLFIVGTGPLEKSLRRLVTDLGIDDRVHFMGELNREELKPLYHACTMFVLPSVADNEAFGMVQLEAMACAKPIVNTALATGVPWVARHGKEALTVPPGDADALSQAIQHLLDYPDEARRMGESGQRRVRKIFDIRFTKQKIYTVYKEVLQERLLIILALLIMPIACGW